MARHEQREATSDDERNLSGGARLQTDERFAHPNTNPFGLLGRGIFGPRPEESAESVLGPAGDDVNVQMGNALADTVVNGDEGSLGVEGDFDGAAEVLRGGEEGLEGVRG